MNEQPFANPANPPIPDLSNREKLTKQIHGLHESIAHSIASNDAKGAAIALLQQNTLLYALLVDELQATQQMFERIDKKQSDMPGAIVKALEERIQQEK